MSAEPFAIAVVGRVIRSRPRVDAPWTFHEVVRVHNAGHPIVLVVRSVSADPFLMNFEKLLRFTDASGRFIREWRVAQRPTRESL